MKRIFAVIIMMLFVFQSFSQVDSIKKHLANYNDSIPALISKGRSLLSEKFFENNMEAVKEIKSYMLENLKDDNYVVFYPNEYWFILYWTQEYEELLNSYKTIDSKSNADYYNRIPPPADKLNVFLRLKSIENTEKIILQIKNSTIDTEKKEILELTFVKLTTDESHQDLLNNQVENYLEKYPETVYRDFAQKYVRYKFVPKNWGVAIEFFTGYGTFSKTLTDYYTNIYPFGMAFDICYKKLEFHPRYFIGFNKIKKDINYSNGTFEKNSSNRVFFWESSFGYAMIDNNRIKLTPFIGVGEMRICPPRARMAVNPELKEISFTSNVYPIGINFDLKFGKENYLFRPKTSYSFLRIRYSYIITKFKKKYDDISGNMHIVTIGIGGMERRLKREY